jgi:hypothetical protein
LTVLGGRNSIGGFNIWRSFPWYFDLRFQEGILLIPIYSSTSSVEYLEVSFIRAEIVGFGSFQEDATSLEDSAFGGVSLGISV